MHVVVLPSRGYIRVFSRADILQAVHVVLRPPVFVSCRPENASYMKLFVQSDALPDDCPGCIAI